VLVGRSAETATIERLLADARDGRSGVLVLRGEAGIGKSTLLDYAAEHAAGFTILRGVGVEVESELAYAALHQILRPVFDRIERLPEPQAAALRAAFALSDETVGERFRVSLGVLGLLAEVAEEQPLLCLVDDAQWLDQASADALLFAARRLEAESLALLLAARDDSGHALQAGGLTELRLRALGDAEARTLVTDRLGGTAAPDIVEWLLGSANGNPLALLELPGALTADQLAGRTPLGGTLAPTTSVELAYLDRVSRLPASVQSLLLVSAAEETGDRATVSRAAAELGLNPAELAVAEAEGLVRVGPDRIEFRHPLVRSAVYRGAVFVERERAHQALASVLSQPGDADRRAWHHAAATVGTDDAVAAELERTAERARDRGGHAAASAALERAAGLSADPVEQGRRLVGAARAASLSGRDERAAALAERGRQLVDDPLLGAEIARVFGLGHLRRGRPDDGYQVMLDAAAAIATVNGDKAAELLSHAGLGARLSGDVDLQQVYRLAQTLDRSTLSAQWAPVVDIMVGLEVMFEEDAAEGARLIHEAIEQSAALDDPVQLLWSGLGALSLGAYEIADAVFLRAASASRQAGSLGLLPFTLSLHAAQALLQARLDEAAVGAAEAARLAREIGAANLVPHAVAVSAAVAATRGREVEARAEAEEAIALARASGIGLAVALGVWTLGMLEFVNGRWEAALEQLSLMRPGRPAFGNPVLTAMSSPDRIEAAARAGRVEEARAELATFEEWVMHSRPSWGTARLACCYALLAEGDEATQHFETALEHGGEARPFDVARIQLAYGEHLRRERRRTDARPQLRAALAGFERMGADQWAERAARELRATGETARKRDPSTIDELTPQELQIAKLVGQGRSNKDVAAQLFLSPRTVEHHLRKVFSKLGITSRSELIRHSVVAGREEPELAFGT
jgi:DNA-binding CsgD family transcriptional regulator